VEVKVLHLWGMERVDVTGHAGEDGIICLRLFHCGKLPYHIVLLSFIQLTNTNIFHVKDK